MESPSRRQVLGVAAGSLAAVAGCVSNPFTSPIASGSAGETTPVEGAPIQELQVAEFPTWAPFNGSVGILRQPSTTEPGILTVTLQNESSRDWRLEVGMNNLPFDMAVADGLFVTSINEFTHTENCIFVKTQGVADVGDREIVESGETLDGRRNIVTRRNATKCLSAGHHQFMNTYFAEPLQDSRSSDTFQWGFTLVLE